MRLNPRVGGPNALSWPAFWAVLVASVLISLPDPFTTWTPASSWRNLLCIVIAVSVMFGVMWALKEVLLRGAAVHPRPWRAVGIFAVGAVVRALALSALLPTVGAGQAQPVFRVLSSLIIMVPILLVTAGLVDLARTSAARRAALQGEANDLMAAEREAMAIKAELQQGAVARVRDLLLQRLQEVRGERSTSTPDDLRRDVEQVIRPMSHRLFEGEGARATPPSPPPPARVSWSDVWTSASLGTPFRPVALASVATVMCLNALVTYSGAGRGLGYAAVQWIVVYAAVSLLRRVLTGPMRRMPAAWRTLTLVAGSGAAMVVAGVLLAGVISATGGTFAWRVPIAIMLLGPAVAFALALDQGFRNQVAAADAAQAANNAGLKMAAALAASERRHEERRLSRALHGPVQTAVTAAAMRVEAGDEAGAEKMLVHAVGQLDPDAHDAAPVEDALAEITRLWDSLCTVSSDLGEGLAGEIDARPATAGAFIDICLEACSNAVRHGGARQVTLRAERAGDAVSLVVSDDGAPTTPEPTRGLGTALLDDVALEWERYRDGDLTVMRATLPLAS